jgi:Undecaprenyl-phosphate glucose phosphotransferase
MPYDASGSTNETQKTGAERRGPLRPSRLKTARTRLAGDTLARLIQFCDLMLLGGVFASAWLRHTLGDAGGLLAVASLLVAATLVSFEAYQLSARERLHRHLYRVVGAVGGPALLLLAFISLIMPQTKTENTLHIVDWCLTVAGLLGASHLAWFGYIHHLRTRGLLTPNVMIVGATPAAERLVANALKSHDVNILGIFDDRAARRPQDVFGVPVLGKAADVTTHRLLPYVDRIVIAVPPGATKRIAELLRTLSAAPNAVSLLVDGHDAESDRAAQDRILDMPLAHLSGARRGAVQAALKRVIDIVFSLCAVLVLAPALVAIAIAIRSDSPGPILFKQRRHGYLNEEVLVWKFRSMRIETTDHTASRQVTANDDRVTRVGRFLRRTSLDELPQLWNVIRGEMSLVGPRPHAIGMLTGGDEASKLVETYAHRHRMKPGLTGWAAVNGSRGPVDTAEAVRRRVSLDLEYVDRQSVWLDLAIMARTLPCVLGDSSVVR